MTPRSVTGTGGGGIRGGFQHDWTTRGVDGKQGGTLASGRANGSGDGVGDVVEFEIEEYGVASFRQLSDDAIPSR